MTRPAPDSDGTVSLGNGWHRIAMNLKLTVYSKACCPLCDDALAVLREAQASIPFELEERDIESDPVLYEKYRYLIPAVELDGETIFIGKVSLHRLRTILSRARNQGRETSPLSPRYKAYLSKLRQMLSNRPFIP